MAVPTPAALIAKGVVPFIKIDKGLEDEANGVQLMKPMPELDALLVKSKALGVYGTKERSVINSANAEGIAAVVAQQFEVGQQVLSHGMMPMIEPEVNIKSETRAECDALMLEAILKNLEGMPKASRSCSSSACRWCRALSMRWSSTPKCCAWSRCRAVTSAQKPASSCPRTKASSPASAAHC
jgi:fructose-bisphosphate aldolase class 1